MDRVKRKKELEPLSDLIERAGGFAVADGMMDEEDLERILMVAEYIRKKEINIQKLHNEIKAARG